MVKKQIKREKVFFVWVFLWKEENKVEKNLHLVAKNKTKIEELNEFAKNKQINEDKWDKSWFSTVSCKIVNLKKTLIITKKNLNNFYK